MKQAVAAPAATAWAAPECFAAIPVLEDVNGEATNGNIEDN
jgi:hypothetical protein